ncbi:MULTISPECIES: PilZ domain-containing protein [Calditerrivibrio]|jgi:c-di-GMP-binding flagellar brake protein YcgR|uniref:PilZ domain-containing protein n=1 Tax=Calditerrivibrio TaxID=545865 RepID=UPI003C70BD56
MERRKYKRYSGIPIRVLLKDEKDGSFKNVNLINLSLGGILIRTNEDISIYQNFLVKIEIPLESINAFKNHDKDVVFAKAIVWRIEADKENFSMNSNNNFFNAALKFIEIGKHEKEIIENYLSNFEENVPYE